MDGNKSKQKKEHIKLFILPLWKSFEDFVQSNLLIKFIYGLLNILWIAETSWISFSDLGNFALHFYFISIIFLRTQSRGDWLTGNKDQSRVEERDLEL